MRSKAEIVTNWLPRYTGTDIESIGEYILLTNFQHYVDVFAQQGGVEVRGRDRPMPNASVAPVATSPRSARRPSYEGAGP